MGKLNAEQIETCLAELSNWMKVDDKWIQRKFRFPSFRQAVSFVNHVADLAEQMDHHPMIAIDFKLVTISLTTWSAQGLSTLDIEQAKQLEQFYFEQTN